MRTVLAVHAVHGLGRISVVHTPAMSLAHRPVAKAMMTSPEALQMGAFRSSRLAIGVYTQSRPEADIGSSL